MKPQVTFESPLLAKAAKSNEPTPSSNRPLSIGIAKIGSTSPSRPLQSTTGAEARVLPLGTPGQNEIKKTSLSGSISKRKPSYPDDQHLLFFSYAQQDCASETLYLAEKAGSKFRGASIFRDADVKFKLDELVEHVKRSRNVIVLLSEHYPRRPFTLVELHTALQHGANVVAVKVARPGLIPFDFGQVAKDIQTGQLTNYLDEDGWTLLAGYGIDLDAVARDLKAVMNVRACDLNMGSAAIVLAAMVEDIFDGVAK